ncbi:phytase esterase [Acinetobacter larvae]|uniref:Phytase esterase n=1 Tax=Acinetobacter larvae TaxID=1789224 RepID=A0A1B2M4C4_9GAMM|nr:phytase esterase [Acinetobacter larvae]
MYKSNIKIISAAFALSLCTFSISATATATATATAIAAKNTATLIGFAQLDVETYAEGPQSGTAVKGAYGIAAPFKAQPVQGFSSAFKNADGTYMVLADNGFGRQDNSADFLLRIYQLKVDFKTPKQQQAKVDVQGFIALKDPHKRIPFKIIHENTPERLLTGADFDPESMQRTADGHYWIGEEFGPYILHFDANGVLLDAPFALIDPENKAQELRSPQNQFNQQQINYFPPRVQQSGGFEGMALSPDQRYLYPILEKPLQGEANRRLLISQFDLQRKAYTGKYYYFQLDDQASNIGEFQLYNDREGLMIERDASQNTLNAYKKIIAVRLNEPGQLLTRETWVDLMHIANPDLLYGTARSHDIGTTELFAFPFETIESVIIEDPNILTIFNDNNFPGSAGRNVNQADNNEIIQIRLDRPLNLK